MFPSTRVSPFGLLSLVVVLLLAASCFGTRCLLCARWMANQPPLMFMIAVIMWSLFGGHTRSLVSRTFTHTHTDTPQPLLYSPHETHALDLVLCRRQ